MLSIAPLQATPGRISQAGRLLLSTIRRLRATTSPLVLLLVFCIAGWVTCVNWMSASAARLSVPANGHTRLQAVRLEFGKAVERELNGGETHSYELTLEAGQFIDITIEQLGINVRGILQIPDGNPISEADSQRGARGIEMVCAVANSAGQYSLKIRSMRQLAVPGRYRVLVTALRAASAQDHERVAAQTQFDIGELERRKTDTIAWNRALAAYRTALTVWRATGERQREAVTLNKLGDVACLMFNKQASLSYAEQALTLYRSLGDRSGEANALFTLGQAYWVRRETARAVDCYEQALPLFRALGEHFSQGLALRELILLYGKMGEKQKALACAQTALPLLTAAGEPGHAGVATLRLGDIHNSLGQKTATLAAYAQARALFQADNEPVLVAGTFWDGGLIHAARGEAAKALAAYEEALAIFRTIGDRHIEAQLGEGRVLISLGALANLQGEKEQALSYYRQALSSNPALRSISGQVAAQKQLGAVYGLLGEWQKAIEQTYQAWLYWRDENGDQATEAEVLSDLAGIYSELGDKRQALALYEQALRLYRTLSYREAEAATLARIGEALHALEETAQARERLLQAVALYRKMGVPGGEAFALKRLAASYEAQGEASQALPAYTRALALCRTAEERQLEGELLLAIGSFYAAQGAAAQAIEKFTEAVKLYRQLNNRSHEAQALTRLGTAYATSAVDGQRQMAFDFHRQAIALAREIREPGSEANAFFSLSRVQRKAGDLIAACVSLESALRLIESIRANVVNQDLRASYLATTQEYFEAYTDLLMEMSRQTPGSGHGAEAFEASERRRARSLLELLAEAGTDIRQGVAAGLVEREQTLLQEISVKSEALRAAKADPQMSKRSAELNRQLTALFLDLQRVRDQIHAANPRLAALAALKPLSLPEIQRQSLDRDTLLLEYSLGRERSYLWAVSPTLLRSFTLPKRAEIEVQAQHVHQLLTARATRKTGETEEQFQTRYLAADKQLPAAAAKLSQMLLGPVAAQLGNKRLLIVADGALQYIPFAALPEPVVADKLSGQRPAFTNHPPLIVNHEIINLPSASTLAVLRRELAGRVSAPNSVAVLADPVFSKCDPRLAQALCDQSQVTKQPAAASSSIALRGLLRSAEETGVVEDGENFRRLEASRAEAQVLAAIVPSGQFFQALDFDANRATALNETLGQYRIIHFATHGLVNSAHPAQSGLVFSLVDEKGNERDGFLRMHEIYTLRLPADLITLSACQTALGREINGEGLIGLTRGFMSAGAARVLATLWKVDDERTASLMKTFYTRLLDRDGRMRMTPAAALRAAQIEMWRSKLNSAPFYWAGFVLQGEYK
jgi:CHAT domain-containing protein